MISWNVRFFQKCVKLKFRGKPHISQSQWKKMAPWQFQPRSRSLIASPTQIVVSATATSTLGVEMLLGVPQSTWAWNNVWSEGHTLSDGNMEVIDKKKIGQQTCWVILGSSVSKFGTRRPGVVDSWFHRSVAWLWSLAKLALPPATATFGTLWCPDLPFEIYRENHLQ